MTHFTIPGISEIFHIQTSKVWTDIELAAEAGIAPTLLRSQMDERILFTGEPELRVSETTEDGQHSRTASLTFRIAGDMLPSHPLCIVIHANDGNWYMIGNRERGARVACERSQGTTESANIITYTIEHTSSHPCVRIDIME